MASPDRSRREFPDAIEAKERRKIKARREKKKNIWFGLGMMGTIGWAVSVPTLIGVAIGVWLDARYSGTISWTLVFLTLGLILGCLNAYYWVKKQISNRDGDGNNEQ